ncbi:MAG: glycerophosphodiester phosphodiesterase [Halioglobus sp.]|nr:glycerophosphodiester phosphodiesterase [Halioglobus sp.]
MKTSRPIIIAHRGASGYLPEHTLAAKAVAHTMGADYMEQDVVLTRDGVAIVLHDIYLDSTTDVAQHFPQRARADGRFYAIDFELAEIRQLRVRERVHDDPRDGQAVYPQRFPETPHLFAVPTLREEIELLAGLDKSRDRRTGIYVEMKSPNWHREEGLDLPGTVLEVLAETGYIERPEQVYLQCFDDQTLLRLKSELTTPIPLIQLLGDNEWGEDTRADYNWLRTADGVAYIASYANGIGPHLSHIFIGSDASGAPQFSELVAQAHAHDLQVHPYTFRKDDLPEGVSDFTALLEIFVTGAGIDGMFTDFPDMALAFLEPP